MPDMNIRNVDMSMLREWKAAAVAADMTLRDWVITRLRSSRDGHRGAETAGIETQTGKHPEPVAESAAPPKKEEKAELVRKTSDILRGWREAAARENCSHGINRTFCPQCQRFG